MAGVSSIHIAKLAIQAVLLEFPVAKARWFLIAAYIDEDPPICWVPLAWNVVVFGQAV